MRTHNTGLRELTGQMLDIGYRGRLHVQNSHTCTLLGNAGAHFPQGLDLADRTEFAGKGGNERLRYPRIALEEYYIERLHYFPLASTARHGNRAVPRYTGVHADTDVNTDERCSNRCGFLSLPHRALGQGLKRLSLELPVLLQQDFHFAFGLLQFFPASG